MDSYLYFGEVYQNQQDPNKMKQSQKIKLTLNKGKVIHGFLPLFW